MIRDRFVSPQVSMLLERMDMYPKEFARSGHLGIGSVTKWGYILESGEFNLLEKVLLKRKLKKLRREITQQEIMSMVIHGHILTDEEEGSDPMFSTTGRFTQALTKKMILNKAQMEALRNMPQMKIKS